MGLVHRQIEIKMKMIQTHSLTKQNPHDILVLTLGWSYPLHLKGGTPLLHILINYIWGHQRFVQQCCHTSYNTGVTDKQTLSYFRQTPVM